MGHTTLVMDGRSCHCGGHGCVETYVGAPGIMQHLRELDPDSAMLHPDDQPPQSRRSLAAPRPATRSAAKVIWRTARYLRGCHRNIINLANPEVIVLSSWVAATSRPVAAHRSAAVVEEHALSRRSQPPDQACSPRPAIR